MLSTHLRSRSSRLMLAASLVATLILGVLSVVAVRLELPEPPAAVPLSDDQTRQQVLEPARQFVGAGKMRAPTGGYLLVSCNSENQPPYQGTVYLNFDVPRVAETSGYFSEIARAMMARGWHEGQPPGRHPGGRTLAKDGLVAVYYRHPDLPGRGVLQIYGECRNVTDHSADATGFVDITEQLLR